MAHDALLKTLRSREQPAPLSDLARLILADTLARPLDELIQPDRAAEAITRGLRAAFRSDAAHERVLQAAQRGTDSLASQDQPLRDLLPPATIEALRESAARPITPNGDLLLRLLDQEPVHALIRELLLDALLGFGQKLRAPVTEHKLGRGLGGLGSFAKRQVKQRSGSLGVLAGGVASAVSGEVERQLERKAAEFADGALRGILRKLVNQMADPSRAADQQALRQALIEGALGLTGAELAEELRRIDPPAALSSLRRALRSWVDRDTFHGELDSTLRWYIDLDTGRPTGELLDELQLRAVTEDALLPVIEQRLVALVGSDAFGRWLGAL